MISIVNPSKGAMCTTSNEQPTVRYLLHLFRCGRYSTNIASQKTAAKMLPTKESLADPCFLKGDEVEQSLLQAFHLTKTLDFSTGHLQIN